MSQQSLASAEYTDDPCKEAVWEGCILSAGLTRQYSEGHMRHLSEYVHKARGKKARARRSLDMPRRETETTDMCASASEPTADVHI